MSVCVLCAVAIQYLKRVFPVWEKGVDHKTSPEQYLDKQEILPLLHGLEGVSGENEIGARAENLLDTLADKDGKGEGFLFKTVVNLRHATRDEMRRRALRRREELLEVITPVYTEGGSCGRIATS
jgi:E3 ubiquitin-protein ligase UBR4